MGQALFRRHGTQVAALCWRAAPHIEVLLITSRTTRRWIIPKGWVEAGQPPAESAAREAYEEAGVTGRITNTPAGTYHYLKARKDGGGVACRVDVYVLEVTRQTGDFPEKDQRRLAWMPPAQAATRLSEPGLRDIVRAFQQHPPQSRPHHRTG